MPKVSIIIINIGIAYDLESFSLGNHSPCLNAVSYFKYDAALMFSTKLKTLGNAALVHILQLSMLSCPSLLAAWFNVFLHRICSCCIIITSFFRCFVRYRNGLNNSNYSSGFAFKLTLLFISKSSYNND